MGRERKERREGEGACTERGKEERGKEKQGKENLSSSNLSSASYCFTAFS